MLNQSYNETMTSSWHSAWIDWFILTPFRTPLNNGMKIHNLFSMFLIRLPQVIPTILILYPFRLFGRFPSSKCSSVYVFIVYVIFMYLCKLISIPFSILRTFLSNWFISCCSFRFTNSFFWFTPASHVNYEVLHPLHPPVMQGSACLKTKRWSMLNRLGWKKDWSTLVYIPTDGAYCCKKNFCWRESHYWSSSRPNPTTEKLISVYWMWKMYVDTLLLYLVNILNY